MMTFKITLDQNPHFYRRLSEENRGVSSSIPFDTKLEALTESRVLHILLDRKTRILVTYAGNKMVLGNVWMWQIGKRNVVLKGRYIIDSLLLNLLIFLLDIDGTISPASVVGKTLDSQNSLTWRLNRGSSDPVEGTWSVVVNTIVGDDDEAEDYSIDSISVRLVSSLDKKGIITLAILDLKTIGDCKSEGSD